MAADFMPVEDMGRRQRTRDAEAAAERENKVPPRYVQNAWEGSVRCDSAEVSQHCQVLPVYPHRRWQPCSAQQQYEALRRSVPHPAKKRPALRENIAGGHAHLTQ